MLTVFDDEMKPKPGAMEVGDPWRIRRKDMDRRHPGKFDHVRNQIPITAQPSLCDPG